MRSSLHLKLLTFILETVKIIDRRERRLDFLNKMANGDATHLFSWHISTGYHYCEMSFHNMTNTPTHDVNSMIQKLLNDYSIQSKTTITFAFINFIPYSKPDLLLHTCYNPAEIAECFNMHQISFMDDLNALLDNITIKIDRVIKILNDNSDLIGFPFPETKFARIRVNLKINTDLD